MKPAMNEALETIAGLELTFGDRLLIRPNAMLNANIQEYIDREQRDIYIYSKPLDIDKLSKQIASMIGIKLRIKEGPLPHGSGEIKKLPGTDNSYAIGVNQKEHARRKRFTKAHELAHLLLHKECIGDGITEDSLLRSASLSNPQETEANSLAAAILMPFYLVEMAHRSKKENVPQILAKLCGVSKIAAQIRLSAYGSASE